MFALGCKLALVTATSRARPPRLVGRRRLCTCPSCICLIVKRSLTFPFRSTTSDVVIFTLLNTGALSFSNLSLYFNSVGFYQVPAKREGMRRLCAA